MKRYIFCVFCALFTLFLLNFAVFTPRHIAFAEADNNQPMLAIIIDDFGGYERGGVETMLNLPVPLTCAVMPFVDNTQADAERAAALGHEVILHMPMESHVHLPGSWYGPVCIKNYDSPEVACQKLDDCLNDVPQAVGANIHIGSGVSRSRELMTAIISHLKEKGKFFCDSRTIIDTQCEEACVVAHAPYLGRDVFLEPHGQRGYSNACRFLLEGAQIAKEKGYAVAIGHVGREGGEETARAIKDSLAQIESMGVEIVPLSQIYNKLLNEQKV